MELRHLQAFVAVAAELHFHRAARLLALTQPALSQRIAQLEAELGVRLFDRSRRHVELTAEGRLLQERATAVLALLDASVEEVRSLARAGSQKVSVGYLEYMNLRQLPAAISRLQERHPEFQLEMVPTFTSEVAAAVRDRRLDVGFLLLPVTEPDLVVRLVVEGHWTLVLRAEHPLAALEEVPVARLAGERLVLPAREVNPEVVDWMVERIAVGTGNAARIVYRTAQAQVGPWLVKEGVGSFMVANYVLRDLPEGVVARRLMGIGPPIQVALAWHRENRGPALRAFLAAMAEGS